MKMSDKLTVKILNGPVTRRFTLSSAVTWDELAANVKELFPTVGAVEDVQLSYVDDDGDQVVFNTDLELTEALHQATTTSGNQKAVRFWLVDGATNPNQSVADSVVSVDASSSSEDAEEKKEEEDGLPAPAAISEQPDDNPLTVESTAAETAWVLAEPAEEADETAAAAATTDRSKGKQPADEPDEVQDDADHNPFVTPPSSAAVAEELTESQEQPSPDRADAKDTTTTEPATASEPPKPDEEQESVIEALLTDVLSAIFNLPTTTDAAEEALRQKREQERIKFLKEQQQQHARWNAWLEQQRQRQQQEPAAFIINTGGLPFQWIYALEDAYPAYHPFAAYSRPRCAPRSRPHCAYDGQGYSGGCASSYRPCYQPFYGCANRSRYHYAAPSDATPSDIRCTFRYRVPTASDKTAPSTEATTSKAADKEPAIASSSASTSSVLEEVAAAQENVVHSQDTTEEIEAEARAASA